MKRLLSVAGLVCFSAFAEDQHDLQLFLLIGQSNMAGRGKVEAVDKEILPGIFMLTKEALWVPAVDPMHFDKPAVAGVGLGRSFAKVVLEAYPKATIGLIPAAFGGTSLEQWKVGGDLYKDALARARVAMKSGKMRGILWHQGEADSGKRELMTSYRERFAVVIEQLRADLGAPDLPVVVGELGEFRKEAFNRDINQQLALVPFTVPHSAFASSQGLVDKGDLTHFDAPSLRELGRRYGLAFLSLERP